MAFVVAKIDTIKSKVNISVPGDLGTTRKADVIVEFKKLGLEAAQKLVDDAQTGHIQDADILLEGIVNIEGLKNEDGSDLGYSADLIPVLCDMDYVRKPLIDAFMVVQFGREILKQKN